jgi:hypothetical protein
MCIVRGVDSAENGIDRCWRRRTRTLFAGTLIALRPDWLDEQPNRIRQNPFNNNGLAMPVCQASRWGSRHVVSSFDKTWRPDEIEPVKLRSSASAGAADRRNQTMTVSPQEAGTQST